MIKLLDTHQHLIYPDIIGYDWTDGVPQLAHTPFTLEDYQGLTKNLGVETTIFLEAGVNDKDYQKETRFIAKLAQNPASNIAALISSCRPETDEGFDSWIEECADLPVAGFRRILHESDDDLSRSETFRANVTKLGRRGFAFDMCFLARQLPVAIELAAACENTSLVLDHCGYPQIAVGELENWKSAISTLSEFPNVACKLSGIMAYCAPGTASLATLFPYLDHVLDIFTPDRLVWGSDWPVVNIGGGIIDWFNVTRNFLAPLANNEQEKIASLNARRIYNINE